MVLKCHFWLNKQTCNNQPPVTEYLYSSLTNVAICKKSVSILMVHPVSGTCRNGSLLENVILLGMGGTQIMTHYCSEMLDNDCLCVERGWLCYVSSKCM